VLLCMIARTVNSPVRKKQGFTLIEIAISIVILLVILGLGVPSINGVLADRRLRRSLDEMNKFVRTAQERSMTERRAYLISWDRDQLVLHPESLMEGEDKRPTAIMRVRRGDALLLKLPAALSEDPPAEWIFWPSGICEPATVTFKGLDGTWTANYSSLTARAELARYATR
jgi:prepilin-type N-terminal cleavage/methylation domain-containing protein